MSAQRHQAASQASEGRLGHDRLQQGSDELAQQAPQRQERQKGGAILGKARVRHHDHDGADDGADHPEPRLAQRSPELGLANDRGRSAGPKGIVELEPERDVGSGSSRTPLIHPAPFRAPRISLSSSEGAQPARGRSAATRSLQHPRQHAEGTSRVC